MKHIYISLGGGCDTSMMMNLVGMRKKSYPFDWLWNLDTGLKSVVDIIRNDFKGITADNVYKYSNHYRFPNDVLVYSKYPSIVHLHTNPLDDLTEHEKLKRRSCNLIKSLSSASFKHFVYYRAATEDIIKNDKLSYRDSAKRLINEGVDFVDMLYDKYPNNIEKISLLLILQVSPSKYLEVNRFVKEFSLDKLQGKYSCIHLGCTFARDDQHFYLKLRWKMQWLNLLINKTDTPLFITLKSIASSVFQSCNAVLLKLLKKEG